MKIFTTMLVVILTVVLGNWIVSFKEGVFYDISMYIFSILFWVVFGFGVYTLLEKFEE